MRRLLNPVLAYRLLVCLLVVLGIQPLLRLPQEIGRLYLGVPLTYDISGTYIVNFETAHHWPGIQAGLRGGDHILTLEGRSVIGSPTIFGEVYDRHREGDLVLVGVRRGVSRLTLSVPVRRYRLADALELHGLWFLTGLSTALAAWLLFRPPSGLMSVALALVAGMLFAHGYSGCADPRLCPQSIHPLQIAWEYGYALLGAVLLHFARRFPFRKQPLPPTSRLDSVGIVGLYMLALTVGTVNLAIRIFKWTDITAFSQMGMLLAAAGVVGGLVRLAWLWLRREPGQAGARVIAGVWGIGTALLLGAGIVPFWSSGAGMLLAQFLLSIAVIYPLLLVYAVRQVELVEALEHEAAEKQRWADLARELRRFREEDLRRVANELHDTVLANLRAVELRLESLIPTDQDSAAAGNRRTRLWHSSLAGQLQAVRETVRQIEQQARRVTMGALPLDFQTVRLREALEDALGRFQGMAPDVDARLEVGPLDAELPAAVREAAYWIAVSALNNCQKHAQASAVRVFLSAEGGRIDMAVRDNGAGFDIAQVQADGLGLRNMRARAAEVGGDLQIESGSWGTAVHFSLTLPLEQPTRMLVVEDSEAFVAGLRAALARWAHEVEIVGVAGSVDQAMALAKTLRPDIVLLDLRISENPDAEAADARHGLRALLELRQMTEVRTVVMSFSHDPAWLRAVSETGAWAFWDKDQDVATLVGLLRRVVAGERLLTAEQWAEMGEACLVEQLSPREWEVLLCLEQGLSNQEIAGRLEISVRTVEKHVQNVRGKLGARSRSEAVAKARELGVLGGGRLDFPPPSDSGA